jgi:hypothetical protein
VKVHQSMERCVPPKRQRDLSSSLSAKSSLPRTFAGHTLVKCPLALFARMGRSFGELLGESSDHTLAKRLWPSYLRMGRSFGELWRESRSDRSQLQVCEISQEGGKVLRSWRLRELSAYLRDVSGEPLPLLSAHSFLE